MSRSLYTNACTAGFLFHSFRSRTTTSGQMKDTNNHSNSLRNKVSNQRNIRSKFFPKATLPRWTDCKYKKVTLPWGQFGSCRCCPNMCTNRLREMCKPLCWLVTAIHIRLDACNALRLWEHCCASSFLHLEIKVHNCLHWIAGQTF